MGYTHYWKTPEPLSDVGWDVITNAAHRIIATSNVPVEAVFDPNTIGVNGLQANAHEDFVLNRSAISFDFCKTARKPYDEIVAAILLVAAETGEVIVSSDGLGKDGHDEEWDTAHALAERALERKVKKLSHLWWPWVNPAE